MTGESGVKVTVLDSSYNDNGAYSVVVTVAGLTQRMEIQANKLSNPCLLNTFTFPTANRESLLRIELFQKSFMIVKKLGETLSRKIGPLDFDEVWLPVYATSNKGGQSIVAHVHLILQVGGAFFKLGSRKTSTVRPNPSLSLVGEKLFSLKVVKAESLAAMDRNGKSDPYCIISYGTPAPTHRTKTIQKTLDPTWDAEFLCTWTEDRPPNVLKIVLKDEDIGLRDDYLGEVELRLSDLKLIDGLSNEWYNLTSNSKKVKVTGRINIQIRFPTAKKADQKDTVQPPRPVVTSPETTGVVVSGQDLETNIPRKTAPLGIMNAYQQPKRAKAGSSTMEGQIDLPVKKPAVSPPPPSPSPSPSP
eukprot:CAMPEP_0184356320 /NCGR_PEP_ID=MMETSP1089-20130417/101979_1 /TAXON_ID=38269 ORGANISM="Gloeochaete wittrockiana, Strain SAG46.84" /NCGR_SAMPLE_ID=MMETSP1089 /ASSEMBLY_ACC=CAM_ASM_000445 /LENGTH=359 /DNA_ID=CAMNT_0026693483 /DNA_START=170 /DNA_END=1246 /DNA_ORIENTATION=+